MLNKKYYGRGCTYGDKRRLFKRKNALGEVTIIEYEKQDEKRRHGGSLYL